jgi:uncharacterized protein (TIGR02466 family)
MEKQVAYIFPTPIGQYRIPDAEATNRELKRLILEREKRETSQVYSNAGGWHSRQDMLDWPDPAIGILRGWILEAVNHIVAAMIEMARTTTGRTASPGRLQVKGWANVSRSGDYHRIHNHPGSCWSGVYYVEAGTDAPGYPLSGLLELLDPRPFTEMVSTPGEPFGQKAIIKPEAGMMVLFPSWLYHFVNPYFGEGERISVSFNVSAVE